MRRVGKRRWSFVARPAVFVRYRLSPTAKPAIKIWAIPGSRGTSARFSFLVAAITTSPRIATPFLAVGANLWFGIDELPLRLEKNAGDVALSADIDFVRREGQCAPESRVDDSSVA